MKMKTAVLAGAALDWAVAQCQPFPKSAIAITDYDDGAEQVFFQVPVRDAGDNVVFESGERWCPSDDWSQGGPIVENAGIDLMFNESPRLWSAFLTEFRVNLPAITVQGNGPTLLIAAMRCYVIHKLGQEIEIPDILCIQMAATPVST